MVLGFDNLENHISERISSKRKENKFTTNDNKAQGDGISSSSSTFTSQKSTTSSPFLTKSGVKSFFSDKKSRSLSQSKCILQEGKERGILGTSDVVGFQKNSLDFVPGNKLGLIGTSSFQSAKASHCVFKGKWQYEMQLGTSGLMQVGWCTHKCRFNREEGVGDTSNSYAFDGYREAKWNCRKSNKYGSVWEAGDIVTCLLDVDNGECSFLLNGKDLGVAFPDVDVGPNLGYFPALSVAYKEVAFCNFGSLPFAYPQEGYSPLQKPPTNFCEAEYYTNALENFISLPHTRPNFSKTINSMDRSTVLLSIMQNLSLHMMVDYNVEKFFFPLLLSLTPNESSGKFAKYNSLHSVLHAFMECSSPVTAKEVMNRVFRSALKKHRSCNRSIRSQVEVLQFVSKLLDHPAVRSCISCSFEKFPDLPNLFHVKNISKHLPDDCFALTDPDNENFLKQRSLSQKIHDSIKYMKSLQQKILQLLVVDFKRERTLVSGTFVKYFRNYLKHISPSRSNEHPLMCTPLVLHSFMQCLIEVIKITWVKFKSSNPNYVSLEEAYIPTEFFYMDTVDYFELQRIGGLKSYLFNEHKDLLAREGVIVGRRTTGGLPASEEESGWESQELSRLIDEPDVSGSSSILGNQPDDNSFTPVLRLARVLLQGGKSKDNSLVTCSSSKVSNINDVMKPALLELVDGCMLLYTSSIQTHMDKINNVKTKISENQTTLEKIESKLKMCNPLESQFVRESIEHSKEIIQNNLNELVKNYLWLAASVYAKESQQNLYWMFQLILKTIHMASNRGELFKFAPEFYISGTSKVYKCLREYMSVCNPFNKSSDLPNFQPTLHSFVKFLSKFHCDHRIINHDVKTSLANTIATFVTYPEQLEIVESLSQPELQSFVKNMMYAYDEDKPWTSVGHRILATLWRGSGFAMRYDHPPYVKKVRTLLVRDRDPFVPSTILKAIKHMLESEKELSSKFVHSILEHLNWSFSEFLTQLQEVQNQTSRSGWESNSGLLASLDATALRQLRIVDMLFELTVALLRVLELTASLAPSVYLDWEGRENSVILLNQLSQSVNQILCRVTAKNNLFEKIVSERQPGLSTVQHYPLMTGTSGILLALVNQQNPQWRERAMRKITAEGSFDLKQINFLLGRSSQDDEENFVRGKVVPYTTSRSKKFKTLSEYEEVCDRELLELRATISNLHKDHAKYKQEVEDNNEQIDEELLCPICYGNKIDCQFVPCKHRTCRTCIRQHLMTSRECFFCKCPVDSIEDLPDEL